MEGISLNYWTVRVFNRCGSEFHRAEVFGKKEYMKKLKKQ